MPNFNETTILGASGMKKKALCSGDDGSSFSIFPTSRIELFIENLAKAFINAVYFYFIKLKR